MSVRNPYTTALVNQLAHVRDRIGVQSTPAAPAIPERIEAFFDAMEIGHGGNRARVCTAIAHTMTGAEIDEAIRRLQNDQDQRADYLVTLSAPEIIVTNERKRHQKSIDLLARTRARRRVG